MDGGYCRLPRAMLALGPVEYNLLVFMVHSAAWKPQRKEVPGGPPGRYVELHRGEVAVGLGFLATATARTIKQVRGALARLEKKRLITRLKKADLPANLCSLYLVENYDFYNGKKEHGADQRADCWQTEGRLPSGNQCWALVPGRQRILEVEKEEKKTGGHEGERQKGEEAEKRLEELGLGFLLKPKPGMSKETRAKLAVRRLGFAPGAAPQAEAPLNAEQARELEEELARVRAHHQGRQAGRVQ